MFSSPLSKKKEEVFSCIKLVCQTALTTPCARCPFVYSLRLPRLVSPTAWDQVVVRRLQPMNYDVPDRS